MSRARVLLWLDVLLLLLVLALQEPRATGLPAHEWIGVGLGVLVAPHLLLNWRWIVTAIRRVVVPGGARRARASAALNAALFVTMTLSVFSGLMISEVALPLVGRAPSELRMWQRIHNPIAVVTMVVVGLHVALNWDWIVGTVGRLLSRHPARAGPPGRVPRPNGAWGGRIVGIGRRFAFIAAAVVVVCGATFLVVTSTASATGSRRRLSAWATPRLRGASAALGLQLLIVTGSALVGRTVLRLKL
jgi:hypothetical protein